ncbi:hypothetical protein scyTo_0001254 [Scyliorhinus torazame]|uniref:Uncharacterized protein n=1 Tax=Scyliorhinus torazame TaxID=75743 RepID=A0A401PB56_SCYTO|nr:hypothetical protein [Scyliorhinus torazame]
MCLFTVIISLWTRWLSESWNLLRKLKLSEGADSLILAFKGKPVDFLDNRLRFLPCLQTSFDDRETKGL